MRTRGLRGALAIVVLLVVVPAGSAWAAEAFTFDLGETWVGPEPSVAFVAGTYACGPFETSGGVIDLRMRQATAGGDVTGQGFAYVDVCDGTPQPYLAEVTSADGRAFAVGPATVLASGYVEGQSARLEREIYLDQAAPTFAFTVDQARPSSKGALLQVAGTYTCGPFDTAPVGGGVVDLSITQADRDAIGSGSVVVAVCDGTPQPYETVVSGLDGDRFRKGYASVDASGSVCGVDVRGGSVCQQTVVVDAPVAVRK